VEITAIALQAIVENAKKLQDAIQKEFIEWILQIKSAR